MKYLSGRRLLPWMISLGLLLAFITIGLPVSRAQSGDASTLISAVNSLRVANGLAPYKVNSSLMAAAQAQSDYQASIGAITHTGAGGSSPSDRAKAAGYGGGTRVFVSENIAGGTRMTAERAVTIWQGDAPHLTTMLSTSYVDVGAGVATDGQLSYFTLIAGYISGQVGSGNSGASHVQPSPSSQDSPTEVVLYISPIVVAKPAADGSIVHEVEFGQVLIKIAEAYGRPLSEILALNDLTDESIIYPGDKIIIKTADVTPTPLLAPTPTPKPTTINRATTPAQGASSIDNRAALSENAIDGDELPHELQSSPYPFDSSQETQPNQSWILILIGSLIAAGTALILVGLVVRPKS